MDQFSTNNQDQNKKNWQTNFGRNYIYAFLLVLVFVIGIFLGNQSREPQTSEKVIKETSKELKNLFANRDDIDVDLFQDVWDIIHNEYFERAGIDDKDLFYGAISGMVDALGDPNSMFFDPELTDDFTQELEGSFFGIGAEIGRRDGYLVVIAPLSGSPAQKAGLEAGDRILGVDDRDVSGMSAGEAVTYIRGEEGTDVVLTVYSPGSDEARDITITRAKIDIPSVTYSIEDGIGIIEISHFNIDTDDRFAKVAQQVLRDNPDGLVVDLRNNPGGYLHVAVDIASYWLDPNIVVVREVFPDTRNNQDYKSGKKSSLAKFKTIVLVNQGSASASEILAGALQDYELAEVVGMDTFGKGSVQKLLELDDESSVKITVAHWLTPKGRTIEGEGISPDYEVDYTRENFENDEDPQLDKAKELIFE